MPIMKDKYDLDIPTVSLQSPPILVILMSMLIDAKFTLYKLNNIFCDFYAGMLGVILWKFSNDQSK